MKELLTNADRKFIAYRIAAYEQNEAMIGKSPRNLKTPASPDIYYVRSGKPEEIQSNQEDVVITPLQKSENKFIAALQVFFGMNIPDLSKLGFANGKPDYEYLEEIQEDWETVLEKARKELELGNYLVVSAALNEYLNEIARQRDVQIEQKRSKDFQEVLKTGM